MSMLTQGTQVYALVPTAADPDVYEVLTIECATAFNPGGAAADQIETTCLESNERTYLPGLKTPDTASLTINADPRNASHVRLHQLSEETNNATLKWAVGWSDGTDAPTAVEDSSGEYDFELPASRTWFTFQGYVSNFPFDFSLNAVVTTEVSIQRSGGSAWIPKEA